LQNHNYSQRDSGASVNNLVGDNIGHCEKEFMNMSNFAWLARETTVLIATHNSDFVRGAG
jgi:hypothetical protein